MSSIDNREEMFKFITHPFVEMGKEDIETADRYFKTLKPLMDSTIYKKIKRHIKRNIIWFLLKFKRNYKNADCEGDYTTVITVKKFFGDLYVMQTESYYKGKRVSICKLEKEDILPDRIKVFNPFEEMQKVISKKG